MNEPARDDDVVVSARTLVRAIVEVRKVGDRVADLGNRVSHLEGIVKTAGLNGHSENIRILAEMAPEIKRRMNDPQLNRLTLMVEQSMPTMEKFVELAPDMIAAFQQGKARAAFWQTLRIYLRPVQRLINVAVGAVVAAAAYILVHHWFSFGPKVP